jgi:hypothetical protein
LSLVQERRESGKSERASAILQRAAEVIALGIDGGSREECLWFAHLARRISTTVLRESDVLVLLRKRREELIDAGDRERLWVATNLGYVEAMHGAVSANELFNLIRGRYDRELLRQFNLQHAKREPGALSLNIAKKIQSPSPMESRVAPWDKFIKEILTAG